MSYQRALKMAGLIQIRIESKLSIGHQGTILRSIICKAITDFEAQHKAPAPSIENMPETAPHSGTPTSKAAADSVKYSLTGLRQTVFDHIVSCGDQGATGSEIARDCDMLLYTAKPRCSELRDAGYIEDSGRTRDNDVGSAEIVWIKKRKDELL